MKSIEFIRLMKTMYVPYDGHHCLLPSGIVTKHVQMLIAVYASGCYIQGVPTPSLRLDRSKKLFYKQFPSSSYRTFPKFHNFLMNSF